MYIFSAVAAMLDLQHLRGLGKGGRGERWHFYYPFSFSLTTTTLIALSSLPNLPLLLKSKMLAIGIAFARYVQKGTLMRCMNCMIDIIRCPLTLILTKTQIILSNMKSYENDKKVCLIESTQIQG